MKLKLTLLENNYYLTLKWNYCGVVAENKTPRAGEDWLRGNDLRDGKLWKLPLVLWDIVCYELNLGRWTNPEKCRIR